LVAAGALKFSDAVQLVRKRGQYMQEAVPAGQGAMAAIMGLSPAVVMDACKRAADGEVCLTGKPEFAGADGDFWSCERGEAGRGDRIAIRC